MKVARKGATLEVGRGANTPKTASPARPYGGSEGEDMKRQDENGPSGLFLGSEPVDGAAHERKTAGDRDGKDLGGHGPKDTGDDDSSDKGADGTDGGDSDGSDKADSDGTDKGDGGADSRDADGRD